MSPVFSFWKSTLFITYIQLEIYEVTLSHPRNLNMELLKQVVWAMIAIVRSSMAWSLERRLLESSTVGHELSSCDCFNGQQPAGLEITPYKDVASLKRFGVIQVIQV